MKKVLIITYYWPPAGGIGVLRCLKIAKYLRSFGYEPVIYTVKNPSYPFEDQSNFKDIPENIEVIRGAVVEFEAVFKKLIRRQKQSVNNIVFGPEKQNWFVKLAMWVRANYFIPDAKSRWIKPSVKILSKYLEENKIDAIFSDGPPHTNTVIACEIAKKFGIPWLSDYQDPWTQVDYYSKFPLSKKADKKQKALEQEAFKYADKIVSASPSFSAGLEDIGAKNTDVLYYGYDEDDFKDLVPVPDKEFTLVHAGILAGDRYPENLVKVVGELIKKKESFRQHFRLKLMGSVEETTLNKIKEFIPEENLILTGHVSRERVLQELINSHILLILVNKENSKGRIPGKLYEYFRAQRPILLIGDMEGDAAELINITNSGTCFEYEEADKLKIQLDQMFTNFENGVDSYTGGNFEQFSNFNQTKKVADWLDTILNERT
ncbi:glycosyl transferase family 1 [Paracrocinitomix mangrovi]|uniref:glycosyl transferase family 1 n=1 Tax=Paracrocinitomix mangrovi TaxID=2862509 RepID=UPI001C8E6AAD|nr:glycosyl transferase family 1 [Paracrocinitomix mangrovi]UKN02785.1 glycosyl transferase family 1 [Paracrocinitomix mangrovi]